MQDTQEIADYLAKEAPRSSTSKVLEATRSVFDLGFKMDHLKAHLAHAYMIENKSSGAMERFGPLLHANPPQIRLLAEILKGLRSGGPTRIIVLKSRKLGSSTLIDLLGLNFIQQLTWAAAVIAHTEDSTRKLFGAIRRAIDHLPPPFQMPVRYNSEEKIEFGERNIEKRKAGILGHQSTYVARTAGGEYVLTGDTIRFLHLSECAKYDSVGDMDAQQRFILSAMGSVPKNGPSLVVAESTANGQQGWMWNTWSEANKGEAGVGARWIPVFISWLEDQTCRMNVPPSYKWAQWDSDDFTQEDDMRARGATPEHLYFRRHVIATEMSMNPDLFDQEFPTTPEMAFIASGRPAIPRAALRGASKHISDQFFEYSAIISDAPNTGTTFSVVGEE